MTSTKNKVTKNLSPITIPSGADFDALKNQYVSGLNNMRSNPFLQQLVSDMAAEMTNDAHIRNQTKSKE